MRTYGRLGGEGNGVGGTWVEVDTDANGDNSNVYLTTLCQTLQLTPGESPFWGSYGIPGQQSVETQVPPDFYAAMTQQQFAAFFASLSIARIARSNPPTYNVTAICFSGALLTAQVAL